MDVLQKASYLFLKYFFILNSKFKGTKRQTVFRWTLNLKNILIFKEDMTFFLRHSYSWFFHISVELSVYSYAVLMSNFDEYDMCGSPDWRTVIWGKVA